MPASDLAAWCRRWRVEELALFGSGLRDEPTGTSDVDLLVTFEPAARWTLFDFVKMRGELRDLLGRPVDLVTRRAVEQGHNELRRTSILASARVLDVA